MHSTKNIEYSLLDFGDGRKLEQFGNVVVDRPSPQADFINKKNQKIWKKADFFFNKEKATWINNNNLPNNWTINILGSKIVLNTLSGGQLGIFPEQLINWKWLNEFGKNSNREIKVLNGFAYTGASTVFSVSKNNNVNTCHLDAAKTSVEMAKKNCLESNIQTNRVRWIVDDVIKFMEREIKRNIKYDGIILDPPAFGRSKKGKVWKLEKDLPNLIKKISEIISDNPEFVIISAHDYQSSLEDIENELLKYSWCKKGKIEKIKLNIKSQQDDTLRCGYCVRWSKI